MSAKPTISASALAGMRWGLAIWSAYAITEYILLSVIPLFRRPFAVVASEHWLLGGFMFLGYCVLGALTGGAAAVLLRHWDRQHARGRAHEPGRLPAALSLLVAVLVNVSLASSTLRSVYFVFVLAAALSIAILWALSHPNWFLVDLVDLHPFLLAIFLIGPTWITLGVVEDAGLKARMLAVGLLVAACFGATWLFRRSPRWSVGKHLISGLSICTLTCLLCAFESSWNSSVVSAAAPVTADPVRPPVVMFVFDTTRASHTSLDGYSRDTTPHLAAFAKGATVYRHAMAAADWTLPSHASIFTGVYPSWHRAQAYSTVPGEARPLDEKLPTLAGILSTQGYSTAAVVANSAYLLPPWGLARGFQEFDIRNAIPLSTPDRWHQMRYRIRALLGLLAPDAEFDRRFRSGKEINDSALSVLARPELRNRSFFLFVNYMDAHEPYEPPAPYKKIFLAGRSPVSYPDFSFRLKHGASANSDERKRFIAQYDGGIAYEDFVFHQFLEALKSSGVYDRAMIVVTADHGEAFGEHGVWGHANGVNPGEVNIHLVIKYPGQQSPALVDAPVSHVDLLPTVLDTLGYAVPSHAQGRSLRHPEQLLPNRHLLAESSTGRALRIGSMKLIVPSGNLGRRQLYDLQRDPGETLNLYSLSNPTAQAMDTAYAQWLRSMPRPITAVSDQDRERLRVLRSLGYAQ